MTMIDILYVDDEESLLEICKVFLEMSGDLNVVTAPSVKEALNTMATAHYDVIVSDYQMPVIDGLKFLKIVREKDDRIPFILFTGRGREDIVIEAYNSGASFYVQKGGDPNSQFVDLEQKIKQAVGKLKAEDAFKESERRFRSLIEKAPLAIAIMRGGEFMFVNGSCTRLFGFNEEVELLSRPIRERLDQASHDMMMGKVDGKEMIKMHEPYEGVAVKGDGTKFNVTMSTTQVDLHDGPATIAFFTDITDRKRTEEEIRISNLQSNMLMDITRSATWEFDVRRMQFNLNDRFFSLLGTDADSEGGYHMAPEDYFQRFVHPEDIVRISTWMQKDLATVGSDVFSQNQYRVVRTDGEVRRFIIRVGTIRNQVGRKLRLYGVVQDVTEQCGGSKERLLAENELSPYGKNLTL